MCSPLSPALCLMVVSISEQIWSINFKQILNNHHLFIRHIRYVDNSLTFGDSRLRDLPPYEVLLDDGFYGKLRKQGGSPIPTTTKQAYPPMGCC